MLVVDSTNAAKLGTMLTDIQKENEFTHVLQHLRQRSTSTISVTEDEKGFGRRFEILDAASKEEWR